MGGERRAVVGKWLVMAGWRVAGGGLNGGVLRCAWVHFNLPIGGKELTQLLLGPTPGMDGEGWLVAVKVAGLPVTGLGGCRVAGLQGCRVVGLQVVGDVFTFLP